ncbi:unnamed protein product [marine sediment metagenome]|uniref:Uncharacterized protein n=1 Tax=marine sediment metagenome TaxID=412755 RepID=X1CAD7_9ZZZZ
MSKGLRNIKNLAERAETIKRRLSEKQGGLGYLAALDARKQGVA